MRPNVMVSDLVVHREHSFGFFTHTQTSEFYFSGYMNHSLITN